MIRIWLPFLAVLCLATPAFAEEAPDSDSAADHHAERAGRLLLSPDAAKRTEGERLLLERIAAGGDLAPFVRRMSAGIRQWADDDSRLVELWIQQAADGDQETRERAVRLITAMGERAVMRMALELGHLRRHERGRALPPEQPTPSVGSSDAPGSEVDTPQTAEVNRVEQNVSPHTPRVYDVTALRAKGMNPVEVLSFLRAHANASEVSAGPIKYVVYASANGHQTLKTKLATVRTVQEKSGKGAAKKSGEDDASKGADDRPAPPPPVAVKPKAPAQPAATVAADEGPRFAVQPIVVRVPRDAALAKTISAWKGVDKDLIEPFIAGARAQRAAAAAPKATRVVGDLAAMAQWMAKAPTLPEARTSYGERITVVPGREAKGFVGSKVPYRRSVRQNERGAWRVDQDILHTGLELRFLLESRGTGLVLDVDARLSEISKPMATTNVNPGKDVEPIELDLPEWNRQTRSDSLQISKVGGGLMLVMPDPAKAEEGLVLILLRVEPYVPVQQQMGNRAPQRKGEGGN